MSETENPKHIPQETAPADSRPEPTTTTPEEKEQAGDAESTNPEEAVEEQSVQDTGDNGADKEAGEDADKAAVEKQAISGSAGNSQQGYLNGWNRHNKKSVTLFCSNSGSRKTKSQRSQ